MMKKYLLVACAACLALVLSACQSTASNTDQEQSAVADSQVSASEENQDYPDGTILVEATEGTLSGAEPSTMDFIMELASGPVAYLGTKGATATYNVGSPAAGTYKLSIKTSDDESWENGYRDAAITVNGVHALTYTHVSENTNGWKWFAVGNISLKAGANIIAFTKANDMPAAFSITELKLEPVLLP